MTEKDLTPWEAEAEEARIEQRLTVSEIFEEGLRRGWATASDYERDGPFTEHVDREYRRWLLDRVEARTDRLDQ